MTLLANWTHPGSDIPGGGLKRERAATEEERAAIVEALGLLKLSGLKARYKIDRLAGGGYRLYGGIESDLAQACVVTLDAVPEHIEESFDTEFWPDVAPIAGEQDAGVLDGRDVERLEHGEIAAGRVIYETLSAALDPYPRRDGVEFDWHDKAASKPEKSSPFAALGKLKNKP